MDEQEFQRRYVEQTAKSISAFGASVNKLNDTVSALATTVAVMQSTLTSMKHTQESVLFEAKKTNGRVTALETRATLIEAQQASNIASIGWLNGIFKEGLARLVITNAITAGLVFGAMELKK